MSIKPGDSVTVDFVTTHPETSAAADADSLPTGTLVKNGTDDATTVTVTNKETGVYKAAVTIPGGFSAGDEVQIRIDATVNSVDGKGIIFTATLDSKRNADLNDLSTAQVNTECDTAISDAALATAAALATVDGNVDTILDIVEADRYIDTAPTPWQLVLIKQGTGGLGVGTELLRANLKDVAAGNITNTTTVIGQSVTP